MPAVPLATSAFGGLAPAALLRPDTDVRPIVAALNANDPETLRLRGPLRVEQGLADATVLPAFTDRLVAVLRRRGTQVTFAERPGVGNGAVVAAGGAASTTWIAQRLRP